MNSTQIKKIVLKMLDETNRLTFHKVGDSGFNPTDGTEDLFFEYPDGKYVWSIMKNDSGGLTLYYYPDRHDDTEYLRFTFKDAGFETKEEFLGLFNLVASKKFNFDKVADDILNE